MMCLVYNYLYLSVLFRNSTNPFSPAWSGYVPAPGAAWPAYHIREQRLRPDMYTQKNTT